MAASSSIPPSSSPLALVLWLLVVFGATTLAVRVSDFPTSSASFPLLRSRSIVLLRGAPPLERVDNVPLFLGTHAAPRRDLIQRAQATHAPVVGAVHDAGVVAGRRWRITSIHEKRILRGRGPGRKAPVSYTHLTLPTSDLV